MAFLSFAALLAFALLPFALIRLAVPRRGGHIVRDTPSHTASSGDPLTVPSKREESRSDGQQQTPLPGTRPAIPFRHEPTIREAPSHASFQGRTLRVLAYLFDGTIVWFALFAFVPGGLSHADSSGNWEFVLLLWWTGVAVCHALWGRTPGKLLCGLKVVRQTNDSPPRFRAALLRESREFVLPKLELTLIAVGSDTVNPVYQASVIVFLLFVAVDFVWFVFDRQARSLHDRIAGTRVVRTPLAFV